MDESTAVNGHPTDGYAVLQLRPGASRELIEEAYWALVGEVKAAALTEPAFSQRVDELNHAYEMLASAPVAARQAAPSPQRRGLSLRRRPPVAARPNDFYQLLHIAPDADPVVVRAAARSATERVAPRDPARDAVLLACAVLTDADERTAYDERRANGHAGEHLAITPHTNGRTNGHAPVVAETPVRAPKRAPQAASTPSVAAMAVDTPPAPGTKVRVTTNGATMPARRKGTKTPSPPPFDDAIASAPYATKARSAVVDEPAHVEAANDTRGGADDADHHEQAPARVSVAVHDTLARIASIVPHRRPELEAAMAEAENDRLLALRADDLALTRTESPSAIEPPVAVIDELPPLARLETADPSADAPALDEPAVPSRAHSRPAARIVFESGPVAGLTLPVGGSGGDNESVDLSLRDGEAAGALLRVVDRDGIFVLIHIDGPNAIVGGQEMTLPVLVLDDGDTIAYGESVARFQLA